MLTPDKKWNISLLSAVVFILVAHPETYKLTEKLFPQVLKNPNMHLLLHGFVYMLISRALMGK